MSTRLLIILSFQEYLQSYFDPNRSEPGYSLAISYGQGGARLSHDHSRQYAYVLQSLSLWREIQHGGYSFCQHPNLSTKRLHKDEQTCSGYGLCRSKIC